MKVIKVPSCDKCPYVCVVVGQIVSDKGMPVLCGAQYDKEICWVNYFPPPDPIPIPDWCPLEERLPSQWT